MPFGTKARLLVQADSRSTATIKHVTVTSPITSDKGAGTVLVTGERYYYLGLFA